MFVKTFKMTRNIFSVYIQSFTIVLLFCKKNFFIVQRKRG
ncbi:hypothetical protein FH5_03196 [Priestia endophytica]|nr:hypothetical protein FH5_03196 [Priestia endophytica]